MTTCASVYHICWKHRKQGPAWEEWLSAQHFQKNKESQSFPIYSVEQWCLERGRYSWGAVAPTGGGGSKPNTTLQWLHKASCAPHLP